MEKEGGRETKEQTGRYGDKERRGNKEQDREMKGEEEEKRQSRGQLGKSLRK